MKAIRLFSLLVAFLACASITMGQVIPDRYIAVFDKGVADPPAAARALAAQHGLAVSHVYEHALKGFAFAGPPQAIAALARRGNVAYIEPDQVYYALGQTIPTGIDRADVEQALHIDGIDDFVDVDIAIIDTGLDSDHPDLRIDPNGVRFYLQVIWIRSDGNWEDDNGHGTHVGGTAAAIDNGLGVVGVAPGARLTAVKVLDKRGSGSLSAVIAGVDWVAARADRFEVANMSLGGGFSQALNDAVKNAVNKGVVFVVAAGNSATDASTQSPASEPTAITVSALADSNGSPGGGGPATSYGADDTFATFSNYGPVIDICAPGVDILSTYPGGYAIGSGTSMASPHVAGAAALYIAYNGLTKTAAGVEAVADALKNSGWRLNDSEYIIGGTADAFYEPLLNVAALIGTVPTDNPPTVSITSPTDGNTVSGEIVIKAEAADDFGVNQVEFFVDGVLIGTDNDDTDGFSATWDTTSMSEDTHILTAEATDTSSNVTLSSEVSVTVDNVPDPIGSEMHCGDLDAATAKAGKNWRATVTVTIHDEHENAVSGATVTGIWSGGYVGSSSGTTDINGMVSFTTGLISKNSSSVTFEISGVTHSNYLYNGSTNHDVDGGSNGTSITVTKP